MAKTAKAEQTFDLLLKELTQLYRQVYLGPGQTTKMHLVA